MQTTTSKRPRRPSEDQVFRRLAILTGFTFTVSAALAADLASAHMRTLGAVCGAGDAPHCLWCLGAASLALAGLAAFAAALPRPKRARAAARPRR